MRRYGRLAMVKVDEWRERTLHADPDDGPLEAEAEIEAMVDYCVRTREPAVPAEPVPKSCCGTCHG